jgi:hypothetical protein
LIHHKWGWPFGQIPLRNVQTNSTITMSKETNDWMFGLPVLERTVRHSLLSHTTKSNCGPSKT